MSDILNAVLDAMLPGSDGFPSGAEVGAAEWLETQDRFRAALEELAEKLQPGFARLAREGRSERLAMLESEDPALFDAVTVAIYSAYYTRPAVLAAIESARGYKATPPQPGGYELPVFDPSILAVPASRAALWRDPDRETSV